MFFLKLSHTVFAIRGSYMYMPPFTWITWPVM